MLPAPAAGSWTHVGASASASRVGDNAEAQLPAASAPRGLCQPCCPRARCSGTQEPSEFRPESTPAPTAGRDRLARCSPGLARGPHQTEPEAGPRVLPSRDSLGVPVTHACAASSRRPFPRLLRAQMECQEPRGGGFEPQRSSPWLLGLACVYLSRTRPRRGGRSGGAPRPQGVPGLPVPRRWRL